MNLFMKHTYRLVAKQASDFWTEGEKKIYGNFISKYLCLVTGNEKKECLTFHLGAEAQLERALLEKELSGIKGLRVVDFYETE